MLLSNRGNFLCNKYRLLPWACLHTYFFRWFCPCVMVLWYACHYLQTFMCLPNVPVVEKNSPASLCSPSGNAEINLPQKIIWNLFASLIWELSHFRQRISISSLYNTFIIRRQVLLIYLLIMLHLSVFVHVSLNSQTVKDHNGMAFVFHWCTDRCYYSFLFIQTGIKLIFISF